MALIPVPTGVRTYSVMSSRKAFFWFRCHKCDYVNILEYTISKKVSNNYFILQKAEKKDNIKKEVSNKASSEVDAIDNQLYVHVNQLQDYEVIHDKCICSHCNAVQVWSGFPEKGLYSKKRDLKRKDIAVTKFVPPVYYGRQNIEDLVKGEYRDLFGQLLTLIESKQGNGIADVPEKYEICVAKSQSENISYHGTPVNKKQVSIPDYPLLSSSTADAIPHAKILKELYVKTNNLHDAGKYAEEIELLQDVIDIAPTVSGTWTKLGMAYIAAGRFQECMNAYRKAIEYSPEDGVIYCNVGAAYARRNMFAEAIPYYETGLNKHFDTVGQFTSSLANYAYALGKLGNRTRAEEMLVKAEKLGYAYSAKIRSKF